MTAFTIDRRDLLETETHHFCAEASELQLLSWVAEINCPGLGNGQPLVRGKIERRNGDSLYADYHQALGCIRLRIFND